MSGVSHLMHTIFDPYDHVFDNMRRYTREAMIKELVVIVERLERDWVDSYDSTCIRGRGDVKGYGSICNDFLLIPMNC